MKLPIKEISITALNPRGRVSNTSDLQHSMSEIGQISPLIVISFDGSYFLADGHRRLVAAKQLGWKEVECHIHEFPETPLTQSIRRIILSSDVRKSLPDIVLDGDEIVGGVVATVVSALDDGETQESLCQIMGEPWDKVTAYKMLCNAPIEVKLAVEEGRMSISAYARIKYLTPEEQIELVKKKEGGNFTVRDAIRHQKEKNQSVDSGNSDIFGDDDFNDGNIECHVALRKVLNQIRSNGFSDMQDAMLSASIAKEILTKAENF